MRMLRPRKARARSGGSRIREPLAATPLLRIVVYYLNTTHAELGQASTSLNLESSFLEAVVVDRVPPTGGSRSLACCRVGPYIQRLIKSDTIIMGVPPGPTNMVAPTVTNPPPPAPITFTCPLLFKCTHTDAGSLAWSQHVESNAKRLFVTCLCIRSLVDQALVRLLGVVRPLLCLHRQRYVVQG